MDFTLSLAHFCELHGPTSVLCTQVLPSRCSVCFPLLSTATSPDGSLDGDPSSYFARPSRTKTRGYSSFAGGNGDRCASCRISLPDDLQSADGKVTGERTPLRTKEKVHVCASLSPENEAHSSQQTNLSESSQSTNSDSLCHSHNLEFVSSSSPVAADIFSSLRRATVRTLSGEQLPRGQTSGPLWFGDPKAGYTIAYVFRLADTHARGRQRYYALLALAGSDTQRAFAACTVIWCFFEQIAMHIVRAAEEVASRSALDNSPPEEGHITPLSSFTAARNTDSDGYARRGVANVRANGIAELVDDSNFFCELHMMFVGILQELGRMLGGMKVLPAETPSQSHRTASASSSGKADDQDLNEPNLEIEEKPTDSGELESSAEKATQRNSPACNPSIVSTPPQQVAV